MMVIKSIELDTVIGHSGNFPDDGFPGFAFIGRSNVGKSSLINTVAGRQIARTSKDPGKTRTVNYYKINNQFNLIDLPGYGYAKVSGTEREKLGTLISRFFKHADGLKAVFLLADIRHEPSKDDMAMWAWMMKHGFPMHIIATKSDKIKRSQLQKQTSMLKSTFNIDDSAFVTFSSTDKTGKEELLGIMQGYLEPTESQ
jgi:GTP-binding protein